MELFFTGRGAVNIGTPVENAALKFRSVMLYSVAKLIDVLSAISYKNGFGVRISNLKDFISVINGAVGREPAAVAELTVPVHH